MNASLLPNPLPVQPFHLPPSGKAWIPGSKSITNRALLLATLGYGRTRLHGVLLSRDTRIMIDALRTLGFRVELNEEKREIEVWGTGGTFTVERATLAVGNAGTAARFLTALLALAPNGEFHLDGDPAMRERPMEGLLRALAELGTQFQFHGKPWSFPFTLQSHGLRGGRVAVDASASSQILSALLMVAPCASSPLSVELIGETVSAPFVTMTRRMIAQFAPRLGKPTDEAPAEPFSYQIEPDATATSYFLMLPWVTGGSVEIPNAFQNPDREQPPLQGDTRFLSLLVEEGLIELEPLPGGGGLVRAGRCRQIRPTDFNDFSDTFLTLAAVAPLFEERCVIEGIGHTRHQETDRIAAMAAELRRLQQPVKEEPDRLVITPDLDALRAAAAQGRSKGALLTIDTYEDHRIAMSFAILGSYDLMGDGQPWLQIADPECTGKTFPEFFEVLQQLHDPHAPPPDNKPAQPRNSG